MRRYCLDTNVLIQAKNGPYAFDIAPQFWRSIEVQFSNKKICISKLVYDELVDGNDELSDWIQGFKHTDCIIIPDENTQKTYREIADYIVQNYPNHQASSFLDCADPWVIAHAKVGDAIVVTHEVPVPSNSTKVKIPNICQHFAVSYVNLYQMMRDLEIRLTN